MEPFLNRQIPPQDPNPTPPTQGQSQANQNIPTVPQDEIKKQMLEKLKDERDELRGTINLAGINRKNNKLRPLIYLLISAILLSLTFLFIIKPATKPAEIEPAPTQDSFVLPSDFDSKTTEERNALQIIEAARKNDSDKIITNWLDKERITQTEEQFKELIRAYSNSADGSSVKLIEKKNGIKSPAQETALADGMEYQAASLLYKSKYFNRTNNIYTRINLYRPDPTQDVWKMYLFEFKEGSEEPPFKAEIEIVAQEVEE
jgi:hypothetical protein